MLIANNMNDLGLVVVNFLLNLLWTLIVNQLIVISAYDTALQCKALRMYCVFYIILFKK